MAPLLGVHGPLLGQPLKPDTDRGRSNRRCNGGSLEESAVGRREATPSAAGLVAERCWSRAVRQASTARCVRRTELCFPAAAVADDATLRRGRRGGAHGLTGDHRDVRLLGGFTFLAGSGDCPPVDTICSTAGVREGVLVGAEGSSLLPTRSC